MTKIQVSWFKGDNRKSNDISPEILEEYSDAWVEGKKYFNLSSSRDRWIITFSGPDLETMLALSKRIMEDIERQAHPMSGVISDARRQFVGDPAAVAELNTVLLVLDKAEKDLRESEARRKHMREDAGQLAQDLKATRVDFMSKGVRDVRHSLESLSADR